ncbi:MAG TPA: biotin/lipoyl-containing protein, partial [Burkholderiales bacterium]
LERALGAARHVEVQVFADSHGACLHLGERDCSVQRRHQKLVEESPSPAVDAALRERMGAAAVAAARSADYVGAGTVEFLLDGEGAFWFMEMNTRLQVEHPVTECLTGIDLVEWQLRVAAGEPLPATQAEITFSGHAIEVRLCAEDPAQDFLPQAGALALWRPDETSVRVDHALETGAGVPPWYDSMIAKFVAHAPTRDAARATLAAALDRSVVLGLETNKAFLAAVLRDAVFAHGGATTDFIADRGKALAAPQPDDTAFALAAVLDALLAARAAGYGEWSAWSNTAAREMRARLRCGARTADIRLMHAGGRFVATVDATRVALRVLRIARDGARVELDGRETTVDFARDGDTLFLALDGMSLRFDGVLHAPPARRAGGPADGRLIAPMNGRVAAVNAAAGDTVDAALAVVVLEAMKMEHGLPLGIRARITALHVAPGAQVSPGQLLAEFEPAVA